MCLRNILCIFLCVFCSTVFANDVTVTLVVSEKTVNITGQSVKALVVNDQLPGPTLHFKEGDHVTINVINHLTTGTTLHWHGLIVPWNMDGVENVSQAPIPPNGVFHYQFTLKQSGTYWYHAHTGFQEQQGLYGAIIIDPLQSPSYHYDSDQVILLSDWSNTDPMTIYKNLKKAGDYYKPLLPLQPSLTHFIQQYWSAAPNDRQTVVADYKMMQQMRMSIYDFSDVAYDAFLMNGHTNTHPWTAQVKVGDVVRLRFIDAGAGTLFHIKIPGTSMQVIQLQGHDVVPYSVEDFTLAPGETLDALVKITKESPYLLHAESADTSGAAVGALLTQAQQQVVIPTQSLFPPPQPVTMMSGMSMMHHGSMQHMSMPMPSMTGSAKYKNVKSPVKTNDPSLPVQEIHMRLSGYMDRYEWFINGVPEMQAPPIIIEPGKRYRLIFVNDSMMHHPMHLHGHWFILRNGHGAWDPLLHTIDVAPGETVIADVDADASGQWIFHCHFLYHMMSGMTRVFRYSTFTHDVAAVKAQPHTALTNPPAEYLTPAMIHHPMGAMPTRFYATRLDLGVNASKNTEKINLTTLIGSDNNKLQLAMEDAEISKGSIEDANIDVFYWHVLNEFWAIKGGANYVYRPSRTPYWQPGMGVEGLMPYFIETNVRTYYHEGATKLDIEFSRDTQLTNTFFLRTGIRSIFATKTVTRDEVGSGLSQLEYTIRPYYQVSSALAFFVEWDRTKAFGKTATLLNNHSTTDTLWTTGISVLF